MKKAVRDLLASYTPEVRALALAARAAGRRGGAAGRRGLKEKSGLL